MASQPRKPLKDLLSISFNQDAGCFACGLSSGFRVFTTEPFTESYRRDFNNGGVSIVEMLFRSNILALVGGGQIPHYPPNKVIIWDDHQVRAIGELVCKTPVRAVRLRKDRIAVALEHKVLLYDLEDLRLIHHVETASNLDGLLALTPSVETIVLAYPGLHAGQVRIDLLDSRRIKIIDAHHSALSAIALTSNGKYVATSSTKGTLIRIFSTSDGSKLKEVRRGSDPAKIFSLSFSRGDVLDWLAASSDKGTVHVFNVGARNKGGGAVDIGVDAGNRGRQTSDGGVDVSSHQSSVGGNNKLALRLKKFVPVGASYLSSEWSWAQYRLPDTSKTMVAFGNDPSTLLIVSVTGILHRVMFDPEKKGICDVVSYTRFMEEEF